MSSDPKSSRDSYVGKVILIAGGGKNLGGLAAREFATGGAKAVVIHYHGDESKIEAAETAAAVEEAGAKSLLVQADLTKVSEIARLFDEAISTFGGVDVAVNTVGRVLKKPYVETTEEEYDGMFATNSKVAYFFIQEAGKKLNEWGKIITIVTSLLNAFTGLYSTYAGSKAGVEHFTRAAAKELIPRGISVTAVGPGPMDTPFFYGQESPEAVAFHKSQSLDGLTRIEDIVPLLTFLASKGWWITGQTIFPNGGYTTR